MEASAIREVPDLRSSGFAGEVVLSGDEGYDAARVVFNAMIDRRPALIARCTGVADVIAAVKFARANDLSIAVRGGGHGVLGYATVDDGIVIDLSPMKGVWIDPAARTARAQAGLTWGDFDRETQAFGLAVRAGASPPRVSPGSRSAAAAAGSGASTA